MRTNQNDPPLFRVPYACSDTRQATNENERCRSPLLDLEHQDPVPCGKVNSVIGLTFHLFMYDTYQWIYIGAN